LFDEIEKAHPDVFNILLQILDDGHLTDGLGRRIDFKNTVLIMTSNIGARQVFKGGGFGFAKSNEESNYETIKSRILEQVKNLFNPEFLNRVDELVVFRHLNRKDMLKIIDIVIEEMLQKVANRNINIELTKGAKEFIAEHAFDPVYGARPLKRTIQKFVEDPIAEELLKGNFSDNSSIRVKKKGEDLEFIEVGKENKSIDTDESTKTEIIKK